jgi:hypothetical protein
MPLGKGVRYRVKTTKSGKEIRLAFKGGKVIEAKNLKTGATHTPSEFEADRKRKKAAEDKLGKGAHAAPKGRH